MVLTLVASDKPRGSAEFILDSTHLSAPQLRSMTRADVPVMLWSTPGVEEPSTRDQTPVYSVEFP